MNITNILLWYGEMGVDEVLVEEAGQYFSSSSDKSMLRAVYSGHSDNVVQARNDGVNLVKSAMISSRFAPPKSHHKKLNASIMGDGNLISRAKELALEANSLDELKSNMISFEGCALKKTAKNMVFGDGNPNGDIMFIGEAPGRDEDIRGLPFVGKSGKLLDKMLSYIGLDRSNFYITNILPWRPPGNRNPSVEEIAIYRSFLDRHISIVNPKLIVLLGGVSAKEIYGSNDGIMCLRGRFRCVEIENKEYLTIATYHPAFLLRQPLQKRLAWCDMLSIQKKLEVLQDN